MKSDHLNESRVASLEDRVRALSTAFEAKGLVPQDYYESFQHQAEEEWSPKNGARVVARAWCDEAFKRRLLENGKAAIEGLGLTLPVQQRHLVVLENTSRLHNVIVCTLCSCTAFTLLGVAPHWYKDFEYRARIVRRARGVLAEMGLDLPSSVDIRVWDTTADTRYIVLPMRPPNTGGLTEDQLAELVTKESMIGVSRLEPPYATHTVV